MRKSNMVTWSMDGLLNVISWSLNLMLDGLSPATKFYGDAISAPRTPLADAWCGALVQVRGDWAWFEEIFNLDA